MAAGFGFSVGDFIAGIELVAKISKALKDSGGASAEYQQVVQQLESLRLTLQQLSSVKATSRDYAFVNAVRAQAQLIETSLQPFLDSITKYNKSLGGQAPRGARHGSARKVEWALSRQPKVAKLQSTIEAQVSTLNLLLNSYNLDSTASIHARSDMVLTEATKHSEQMVQLQTSVHRIRRDMQQTVLQSPGASVDTKLSICGRSSCLQERIKSPKPVGTSSVDLEEDDDNLENPASGHQVPMARRRSAGILLSEQLPFNTLFLESNFFKLSSVLSAFFENLLSCAMLLYPRLILLLNFISSNISGRPLKMLQDSISFEDILGRVHHLQYQHFQHLEVFEAMLRCTFKQKPGANLVMGGQYNILNAVNHSLIPRDKWGDKVFPGTKIVMSAIIDSLRVQPGSCPRVGCEGRFSTPKTAKQVMCAVCSLIIYPSHQTEMSLARGRGIEDGHKDNQRSTIHEIAQEPWWRRLNQKPDREGLQSGQDRSENLDPGQAEDHDHGTMDVFNNGNSQSAGRATKNPLERHDNLDTEQQEIDVFRRIHVPSVPTVGFAEIHDLYSVGSTVYTVEDSHWCAFQIRWSGRVKDLDMQIYCKYFSHNENGISLHPRVACFVLPAFQGRKKVTDLPLIPAILLAKEDVLRQSLIERGWQYWNLGRSIHCLECVGEDSEGHSKERVIIDLLGYHDFRSDFHKDLGTYPVQDCDCFWCSDLRAWKHGHQLVSSTKAQVKRKVRIDYASIPASSYQPESEVDERLLYCPLSVGAFSLAERNWKLVRITALKPISWGHHPLSALVPTQDHCKAMEAMARTYLNDWEDSTVKEKGKGLTVVLHSQVPGVGKRLTALAFAEHCRRPCLRLTGTEIGTSAQKVEEVLEEIFRLSQNWNCVLLIERAEFFLEARSKTETTRNSCVKAFLRALEHHTGILFLTTSKKFTFDDAFKSRIHMSLYYAQLEQESTFKIWQMILNRISRGNQIDVDVKAIERYAENHINARVDSKKAPWTGKQIKDAFRFATAVAESEAKANHERKPRLRVKHFEESMKLSEGQI